MYIWTSIYRRSFLEKNQIRFRETPSAAHQDISFYLKTMALCKKIYLVPESYLYYRVNRKDSSVQHLERRTQFYDEFMGYWSFLRQRSPEEQAVGAAAAPNMLLRYRNDVWPVLTARNQYQYLKQAWKDFQKLGEDGLLIEKYWTHQEWSFLQKLLDDPEAWLAENGMDRQRKITLRRGLLAALRGASKAYLYGAGQVAKWMMKQLQEEGLEVKGLLVESLDRNPKQVDGIPVRQFADRAMDRESSTVLIALSPQKEDVQHHVYCALKDAGYRHVILLTKELREIINFNDDA